MKRLLILALLLASFRGNGFSQSPKTSIAPTEAVQLFLAPMTAAGYTDWIDVTAYGGTSHALKYVTEGTASALTIALQCSRDKGSSVELTIGTSTATSGGTIRGDASCTHVRVYLSTFTAGTRVWLNYFSSSDLATHATAITIGTTAYASSYDSGMTTIASGSTSTIVGASRLIQSITCVNRLPVSITVTVMDGGGNYYIGPLFSIPAYSHLDKQYPSGLVFASGITASASQASAIGCQFNGRQP